MSYMDNQTQRIIKADPVFFPHLTDFTVSSESVDSMIMEGGEDFYNYVNSLGLETENMIVLSSQHHYYYDADEIAKARTFIHLKELNDIHQIKNLLNSYMDYLPENCNFIGSFVNNEKYGRFALKNRFDLLENRKNSEYAGLHIVSRNPFINMVYNILDHKTNNYMTVENVAALLKDYNFEILDMTEKNERTYFHSMKITRSYNLSRA